MRFNCSPLVAIVMTMAGGGPAVAQTLGGSITCTETISYLPDPNSDLVSSVQYSNWQWTDFNGVVHSFTGSTYSRNKYTYSPDGSVIYRGGTNTSLTNVQATDGSDYYLNATGALGYVNSYGVLKPKYQVLSVIYAAPGSGSLVNYSSTSVAGNSTNLSRSFANGIQFSATVGGSFFGLLGGTSTYGGGWSETVTDSKTVSVTKAQGTSFSSSGQTAPPYGINHDYDQIVICLNPAVLVGASTSSAVMSVPKWTLAYDLADTNAGTEPDIVYLTVGQLKNPSLITDQSLLNRLARTWAGPGQGLTTADFQTILGRNPFANDGTNGTRPAYDIQSDNNRFYQVRSIPYAPLAVGEGSKTESGDFTYSTTTAKTVNVQDVYSVSSTSQASVNFFVKIGITSTSNYTWTNTASQTVSSGTTQQSGFSVPRPPSTWTGPSEILVYQDMVYGTFFFSY